MSLLALATWSAIVILLAGSVAVFVWFLFDVGDVLHGEGTDREGDGKPTS